MPSFEILTSLQANQIQNDEEKHLLVFQKNVPNNVFIIKIAEFFYEWGAGEK